VVACARAGRPEASSASATRHDGRRSAQGARGPQGPEGRPKERMVMVSRTEWVRTCQLRTAKRFGSGWIAGDAGGGNSFHLRHLFPIRRLCGHVSPAQCFGNLITLVCTRVVRRRPASRSAACWARAQARSWLRSSCTGAPPRWLCSSFRA